MICVNAAGEREFFGREAKNPQLHMCEIITDDSELMHVFLMALTCNCLTLITYCRYVQKLKRIILASCEINEQTGKFFMY